jgi:hypothetical protein
MPKKNPYKALRHVFVESYLQASEGKGAERHSMGESFEDQPICVLTRQLGLGFPLGQAMKKIIESQKLSRFPGRAKAELLGAINYIAAAVIVLDEEALAKSKERKDDKS